MMASAMTEQAYSRSRVIMYLWQLPYDTRKQFCELLDADKSWRELGGSYVKFTDTELELFSHAILRKESATNALLTKWEQSNPTVTQLYVYLCKMKHKRAMLILRPFVEMSLQTLCDKYESLDEVRVLESLLASVRNPQPSNDNRLIDNDNQRLHHHHLHHLHHMHHLGENHPKSGDQNQETQPSDNFSAAASTINAYDDDLPYSELLVATNNFCKSNIIGSGGFGVVYKGFWKGTKVAIKRLKDCVNSSQAMTELRVLSQYRIDNIVPLYGICLDGPEPCLIYQYMVNGSLDNRLQCKNNSKPLSWIQRAVIGEGVAKALNYLHTRKGNPLIHGDVKSANILLDAQMQPKLGDFGLARFLHSFNNKNSGYTHMTVTSVHGTVAYLPPEYLRNKILSSAVDVYSYGVVMLEMATGKRAFDGKELLADTIADQVEGHDQCGCTSQIVDRTPSRRPTVDNSLGKSLNNELLKLIDIKCDCYLNKLTRFKDRRLPADAACGFWFDFLVNLGLICCKKSKKKRPSFAKILELYEEMDRLRSCSQFFPAISSNGKSTSDQPQDTEPIKTPFEMQLWKEIIQKDSNNTIPTTVQSSCNDVVSRETEVINISNQSNLTPVFVSTAASTVNDGNDSDAENCIIPLITELGITNDTN